MVILAFFTGKGQHTSAMALLGWERGFELWARKVLLWRVAFFELSFSEGTHLASCLIYCIIMCFTFGGLCFHNASRPDALDFYIDSS